MPALTDAKIRAMKTTAAQTRVADTDGLYIEVTAAGKKRFRFRYQDKQGKRRWHTIGDFPIISLAEARAERDRLRRNIYDGDPVGTPAGGVTFGAVAEEWMAKLEPRLAEGPSRRTMINRVYHHIIPALGNIPIKNVGTQDVLALLKRLEARGTVETAHRVQQIISRIFRYGAACQYCDADPASLLKGALAPAVVEHMGSIQDPQQVGELMRAIDSYPNPLTRNALLFTAYTFCRQGEIRHAEWGEIDFARAEWRIPAEKMKKRRPHIVPLAPQVVAVLEAQRKMTDSDTPYVFVNNWSKGRPMSENAILSALRRMGYEKGQMTGHGFRSMASTILNENGFQADWIERQLAHVEGNSVRAAYNYADYLKERRAMMEWYANHLDALRDEK